MPIPRSKCTSPSLIHTRIVLPVNDALQEAEAVGSLPLDFLNGLHELCLCRDLRIISEEVVWILSFFLYF